MLILLIIILSVFDICLSFFIWQNVLFLIWIHDIDFLFLFFLLFLLTLPFSRVRSSDECSYITACQWCCISFINVVHLLLCESKLTVSAVQNSSLFMLWLRNSWTSSSCRYIFRNFFLFEIFRKLRYCQIFLMALMRKFWLFITF